MSSRRIGAFRWSDDSDLSARVVAMATIGADKSADLASSAYEAGLIGDHDELRPVSSSQFDHGPAYVGTGGGSADH